MRLATLLACLAFASAPVRAAHEPLHVHLPFAPVFEMYSAQGNTMLAVKHGGQASLIELPSARVRWTFDANGVNGAGLSPDGRRLAITRNDGTLTVFGPGKSARTSWKIHGRPGRIQFLPHGLLLVGVQLWDIGTHKTVARLDTRFGPMTSADTSPDGRFLATGGGDTVVRVYDTRNWKEVLRLTGLNLEALGIAYARDGSRIVTGGVGDRLDVIDAADGRLLRTIDTGHPGVAGIQPSGMRDWMLVKYLDPRSNKPESWLLVNIVDESMRKACGPVAHVRTAKGVLWCYRVHDATLTETPRAMP